jgi:hypothetical protein
MTEREKEVMINLVKAYVRAEATTGQRSFPEEILTDVNAGLVNKFSIDEIEAIKKDLRK